MESDIAKDASTEASIFARALDVASDILAEKGQKLPEHLIMEARCVSNLEALS